MELPPNRESQSGGSEPCRVANTVWLEEAIAGRCTRAQHRVGELINLEMSDRSAVCARCWLQAAGFQIVNPELMGIRTDPVGQPGVMFNAAKPETGGVSSGTCELSPAPRAHAACFKQLVESAGLMGN
jgi:hypothetical protein